jgi:hypothetical protein
MFAALQKVAGQGGERAATADVQAVQAEHLNHVAALADKRFGVPDALDVPLRGFDTGGTFSA